ncbi:hypothetical protein ACFL4O_02005 [bacterium]
MGLCKQLSSHNNEKGILIVVSVLLVLVFSIIGTSAMFLIGKEVTQVLDAKKNLKTLNIAEAGINKAIQQIIESVGVYSGETDTPLGDGVYSVVVSTITSSLYQIVSTGHIPNSINPKYSKRIKCTFQPAESIVQHEIFSYAVAGGTSISLRNLAFTSSYNPSGNGNIRCNGAISCRNLVVIDGDIYASGRISFRGLCFATGDIYRNAEPMTFPTIDMEYYKEKAKQGGIITGNVTYNSGTNDLAKYIKGNLTIKNSAVVNLTGTVYVEGNVLIKNRGKLKGGNVLCTQGTVTVKNISSIGSHGEPVSVLTNSNRLYAISLQNASTAAECILYAPNGGAEVRNAVRLIGSIAANNVSIRNAASIRLPGYKIDMDMPGSSIESSLSKSEIISWEQDKI